LWVIVRLSSRGDAISPKRLLADSKKSHTFVLDQNAWLVAFDITSKEDHDRYNQRFVECVRTVEQREQKKRERFSKKVIGAVKLQTSALIPRAFHSYRGANQFSQIIDFY
jgi:hypothetical protein